MSVLVIYFHCRKVVYIRSLLVIIVVFKNRNKKLRTRLSLIQVRTRKQININLLTYKSRVIYYDESSVTKRRSHDASDRQLSYVVDTERTV